MIPPNIEQHLGRRTWLLLLFKKTILSIVLLLLALILGSAKGFIGQGMSGFLGSAANSSGSASHLISSSVSFVAVVILIIAVIMFIVGYIVALLYYRNYTFMLEEFGLKLKKGIFDIKEISIPYRQIQSVDVMKPFNYQIFGVSRLMIITAGHEDVKEGTETDTVFDPIDAGLAEEIRVILQRKIGIQVTEGENKADAEVSKSPTT